MLGEQVERAAHAAEHAEPEDIDLHQAELLDILLLPFHHPALRHRGGLDGDEVA